MRAAVFDRYGPADVLAVRDVARPEPGPGQVLVRIGAASVNPKDTLVRKGRFKLVTRNRFPMGTGCDFAGTVEALGAGVTGLAVGLPVWGMLTAWQTGTCAEFVTVAADGLGPSPPELGVTDAAAMPLAALTALQALRDLGRLAPEDPVLINGASGGVGHFAVQIAKAIGMRVVAVASARNGDFLKRLGADRVVAYEETPAWEISGRYRCWFDVFGNAGYLRAQANLAPGGTYVTTVPNPRNIGNALTSGWFGGRRARLVIVQSRRRDLDILARLVSEGKLRPTVDTVYPLERIADAHRHVEGKHTVGKVVVQVG